MKSVNLITVLRTLTDLQPHTNLIPLPMCKMVHNLILWPMVYVVEDIRELILMFCINLHAPSNRNSLPSACYKKHEQIKKRAYQQRVRKVEHASFTSLVFSTTGGIVNEAIHFCKTLAFCLAKKWDHSYSSTISWLCCRVTFLLQSHSTIQSQFIQGTGAR